MKTHKRKRKRDSHTSSKKRQEESSSTTTLKTIGTCDNVKERYKRISVIGKGTYGVVYLAHDLLEDSDRNRSNEDDSDTKEPTTTVSAKRAKLVALKRCIPHHESSDGFPMTTMREIHALRLCSSHPNIVTLQRVAVSPTSGGVYLVFDYCTTDIAKILDHHQTQRTKKARRTGTSTTSPFTEAQCKTLLKQLLSAVDFVHQHHLLHRDIKPSNLLYTEKGQLQLADFGLSRHVPSATGASAMTPQVVSLWYRAPELFSPTLGMVDQRQRQTPSTTTATVYASSIDIWAIGCVFVELIKGTPLLDGRNELEMVQQMSRVLGNPTMTMTTTLQGHIQAMLSSSSEPNFARIPGSSGSRNGLLDYFNTMASQGIDLLSRMLRYDSKHRISTGEALKSTYFDVAPFPATRMPDFGPLR